QRLNAERDAVDACGAVSAESLRLDRGGVRFQRHLDTVGDGPAGRDRVEDGADRLGLHQGRRAAADENGRYRARAGAAAHGGDLSGEGCGEALLVDRLVADMAVEVAIGALGRAERPVDVDAEARR